MAGSNKWFGYQDDIGTDWAIFADESNVEGVNGGGAIAPLAGTTYKPPRNLRLRYAVYGNQAGTRRLKVPVLTQTIYNSLTAGDTLVTNIGGAAESLAYLYKRPEIVSPSPTVFDSGLDDGDQP
jgi:hypothetical protein